VKNRVVARDPSPEQARPPGSIGANPSRLSPGLIAPSRGLGTISGSRQPMGGGDGIDEEATERLARRALNAAGIQATMRESGSYLPPIPVHGSGELSSFGSLVDGAAHRLGGELRARLEAGFGRDLGDVRLHDDGRAANAARAVRARAFAYRRHVFFGRGQFAPSTPAGMRLLAHELAHVEQNTPATAGSLIQRDGAPKQETWLPELKEILPGPVGPIVAIDRDVTLLQIFGEAQLEALVRAINGDVDAKKFTKANGVPAIVALYDTSRDGRLDVKAARKALDEHGGLYKREALEHARRQAPRQAPRSFLFESPEKQRPKAPAEGEMPIPGGEERQVVFTEHELSTAGRVFVRFSYPDPEKGSKKVEQAKRQILLAIATILKDLAILPPAASHEERREQSTVRAKLAEPWAVFTRTRPLNIYIATDPRAEFASSQVAAFTDRVFINLTDVGHEDRLQAAVRIPLIMLRGGILPTPGGLVDVPPIAGGLPATLLHEAVHVLLIQRAADAESVWLANQRKVTIHANPYLSARFTELARKFLLAQEEVFAYESEASLYPPISKEKAEYDIFIKNTARFLDHRGLVPAMSTQKISVRTTVGRKAVSWSISYLVPEGEAELGVADQEVIDLLLAAYPTR
jgi:hypothetical protein